MQEESGRRPWIRLAVTAALLAIYAALRHLPLPGIDRELQSLIPMTEYWWLGIRPFLFGFLLVELYSLLLPGGRRLRRGGAEGRRALNKGAFLVSVSIATIQSYAIYQSLDLLVTPGGLRVVSDPGSFAQIVMMSSIVCLSVVAFYLCRSITVLGLGNGFCWLLIFDLIDQWNLRDAFQDSGELGWTVVVCVGVAATLIFLQRGDLEDRPPVGPRAEEEAMVLGWPQGIVPLYAGLTLPVFLISFGALLGVAWPWSASSPASYWITVLSIPILSWICLHLFSTRKRIERNTGLSLSEGYDRSSRFRFFVTTAVSTLLSAAYILIDLRWLEPVDLPSLVLLLLAVAVARDVIGEWRFRSRTTNPVSLIELDNVHLANYLLIILRRARVPCFLQAFHLRSLLFFFGPLYKIRLLVSQDRLQEACDLIAETDTSVR